MRGGAAERAVEAEDVPISAVYLSRAAVVCGHFDAVQRVLARLLVDGDPYPRDAGHGACFYGLALAAFLCGVLGRSGGTARGVAVT